jgi:hypothetical protein
VSHVQADPLQRVQLAKLPLSRFRAALVLADERWADPDGDDSNGIDGIDEPSVLRQDALMVMVQVMVGEGEGGGHRSGGTAEQEQAAWAA